VDGILCVVRTGKNGAGMKSLSPEASVVNETIMCHPGEESKGIVWNRDSSSRKKHGSDSAPHGKFSTLVTLIERSQKGYT